MTVKRYRGDAPAVAQVATVQITVYDATTTYILTVGAKTVSVVGDTNKATTATALAAAWNASTESEFAVVTANSFSGTTPTDTITLTADTAGVPFIASKSTTGGIGDMGAVTEVTASAGPYHLDTAGNWEPSGLPATGDDVIFEHSAIHGLYGLDTSEWPGGQPAWDSLTFKASYTGYVGLPEYSSGGDFEYRADFFEVLLQTGNGYIEVGEGSGSGSGRIKLRIGIMNTNLRIDVHSTGPRADEAKPPLLLATDTQSAETTLNVNRGDVGVAVLYDDLAEITTFNVGFVTAMTSDAKVTIGDGVTLATINQTGGTVKSLSNVTTATLTAGTLTMSDLATAGTIHVRGGTCYYNSSGALTTVNVTKGAVLDFRRDQRDVTVTNMNLYEGATVYDTAQRVTLTNGFDLIQCSLADVTVNFGDHRAWTPSPI